MDISRCKSLGYQDLLRHPKLIFLVNPRKHRYLIKFTQTPSEREFNMFFAFIKEIIVDCRNHSISIIDDMRVPKIFDRHMLSMWFSCYRELIERFPVRKFVRILNKEQKEDSSLIHSHTTAELGEHVGMIKTCFSLEEAETYLDSFSKIIPRIEAIRMFS